MSTSKRCLMINNTEAVKRTVQQNGLEAEPIIAKHLQEWLSKSPANDNVVVVRGTEIQDKEYDIDLVATYTADGSTVMKTISVKSFPNCHKYSWNIPLKFRAIQVDGSEKDRWWLYGKADYYCFVKDNEYILLNAVDYRQAVDEYIFLNKDCERETKNYGEKLYPTQDVINFTYITPINLVKECMTHKRPMKVAELPLGMGWSSCSAFQ